MKKMLIVVMVIMAASVQAVALKWGGNLPTSQFLGLTGNQLTTGVGSQTANLSIYYILVSDLSNVQSVSLETDADNYAKASASGLTTTLTSSPGRVAGSAPNIPGSSPGISYFARVYTTFGSKDYYMDIKNGGKTSYWTTTATGNDTVIETMTWLAAAYGGTTGVSGDFNKWVAVPEPTSMALLVLGVAAIGLRRKFRK